HTFDLVIIRQLLQSSDQFRHQRSTHSVLLLRPIQHQPSDTGFFVDLLQNSFRFDHVKPSSSGAISLSLISIRRSGRSSNPLKLSSVSKRTTPRQAAGLSKIIYDSFPKVVTPECFNRVSIQVSRLDSRYKHA